MAGPGGATCGLSCGAASAPRGSGGHGGTHRGGVPASPQSPKPDGPPRPSPAAAPLPPLRPEAGERASSRSPLQEVWLPPDAGNFSRRWMDLLRSDARTGPATKRHRSPRPLPGHPAGSRPPPPTPDPKTSLNWGVLRALIGAGIAGAVGWGQGTLQKSLSGLARAADPGGSVPTPVPTPAPGGADPTGNNTRPQPDPRWG